MGLVTFYSKLLEDFAYHCVRITIRQQFKSQEEGKFVGKLIMHTYNETVHFGIANTMAALRENWWIPRLRSKVKRIINGCNVCKAYRVKPYSRTATAELPKFRMK